MCTLASKVILVNILILLIVSCDRDADVDSEDLHDGSAGADGDMDADADTDVDAGTDAGVICKPLEKYCEDNKVKLCRVDGKAIVDFQICSENEYCDETSIECKEKVCEPGMPTCLQDYAHVCNDAGTGFVASYTDCKLENKVCENGDCITAPDNVVDELGGNSTVFSGADRMRGMVILCDRDRILTEIEFYLNFTGSETLQWVVYESPPPPVDNLDDYIKILDQEIKIKGEGEAYYSSGPVSVKLKEWRRYAIGVAFKNKVSYYSGDGNRQTYAGQAIMPVKTGPLPLPEDLTESEFNWLGDNIYMMRITTDAPEIE